MLASIGLAAMLSIPPCWQIYDGAVRHSAASAHPAYVDYNERITIVADSLRLVDTVAHVDYRDSGLARVSDARFDNDPFVTRHVEPGPPVLGPYGENRQTWLPTGDAMPLPVIGDVRVASDLQCSVHGVEPYKGHSTYHLVFERASADRPALKELWIDMNTADIWKIVLTGYVRYLGDDQTSPLATFEVELARADRYLTVQHVTWHYRLYQYAQYSNVSGEYYLSDFAFPQALPDAYFQGLPGSP